MIPKMYHLRKYLIPILILSYNITLAAIDNAMISKIQANLSQSSMATIPFEQIDKNNQSAKGQLLIQKPYYFRCNYYAPFPLLIVGGKKYLSIYDYNMETLSRLEAGENILSILLQDNWSNNKTFKILDTQMTQDYFVLRLLLLQNQEQSEIYFDKSTLELEKIKIFEMGQVSVTINFDSPIKIKQFNPELFEIPSLQIFGKPKRLNKKDLQKLYLTYDD